MKKLAIAVLLLASPLAMAHTEGSGTHTGHTAPIGPHSLWSWLFGR